ncbi:MAG: VWA domain-containing protein, partial [Verrucomicrobiota bacterium]
MTFADPRYLWLLLAVPPAMAAFFWWSQRVRQRLMRQFIHARLLPGLVAGDSPGRQRIREACLILAVAGLIFALAQPQWGYDLEQVQQRGLDIVVAIDTSKSMLAEDIAPNRIERAKLAALDLMQQAKSDRMGLVAFAGDAFLQCPLTVDDTAFRQSVQALDVNTIPEGGTAVAEAIGTALEAFKEGDNYKVLVLFTDGEDHDSGALEAAKNAAKSGLRIFTVGIGSAQGALLRIKNADGQMDYIRDENGNVVQSRLNEALLQEIAGAANGFYLPLRGADTIDTLYKNGLAPLPRSELKERWIKRPHERYHWPLAIAMALLVVELLLPERKQPGNVRSGVDSNVRNSGSGLSQPPGGGASNRHAAAVVAAIALLAIPAAAFGSPSSALREYKSGHFDRSLKDYEQSLEKKGDDPRLHFNAGAAAYRNGQFDQAARHFGQALTSPDLSLQQEAYYNLGNALFHQGEQNPDPSKKSETWQESLKQFESSLKLNSRDADAKFNYDFVKKKLEELKKQQQQQQQKQQHQQQSQQDQSQQNRSQQGQNGQNNQRQDRKQNPGQQQQAQKQTQPDEDRQQQANKPDEKKDRSPQEQQPAEKSSSQE